MSFGADDHRHMAHALRLARRGLCTASPNPRVGCVLVREGRVVGEGWHERTGGPHAEIVALEAAGDAARGATAYVTLEPCAHHGRTPPCADALVRAGVARVVAAMEDPNPQVAGRGLARLREAGVEVAAGLMAAEAEALNPGFVRRMRAGRPWVRVKLAASLDGRTALASGESRWITGEDARRDVHRLRARSDALVTGIGTVLADDPAMTVRLPPEEMAALGLARVPRRPLRVVLDPHLAMPENARIIGGDGRCLVLCGEEAEAAAEEALRRAGAEVVRLPGPGGVLDPGAVLDLLAAREVNEVMVETGARLAGAFVAARLADELWIYLAPALLGHEGRPLLELAGIDTMERRLRLVVDEVRPVGADLRLRARLAEA
ncbi:bifunctional diaminohydroxyphosphoribosylaminopyrimidine deaminase/5-amino-6-(5-phosphoribosylamino)uracil reductase RibD [Inmirania thermothiophila]|uniref:Riboflavin biosynthesis protein RibD n=1 Tax=Inmirania thermothiophila TaxID=1750597 RepID=A0A3N1Y822_9GAMM|nr:bifunctional diaminohydroxyphosphoribosylaminopyrimidine deaminase/5-amino-6-(5-phosphoribosylamino)uracil reductase RibD [Inmirania thermothiophila]ROR34964.1 diaminohydroxyphosphoribosylaminopyrimidine deaminase [Inmirania thermothiophila]